MAKFETYRCSYSSTAKEGNAALYSYGLKGHVGYFKLVDPLLSVAKLVFWGNVKTSESGAYYRLPGYLQVSHPSYGTLTVKSSASSKWGSWELFEVYFIYDPDTDTRVGVAYVVDPNTGKKTLRASTGVLSGAPSPGEVSIIASAKTGDYYGYILVDSLKIYGVAGEVVSERSLPQIVSSVYETLLE